MFYAIFISEKSPDTAERIIGPMYLSIFGRSFSAAGAPIALLKAVIPFTKAIPKSRPLRFSRFSLSDIFYKVGVKESVLTNSRRVFS